MNSDDLNLFARVACLNGISCAALETETSQSTVSRRIATLEASLGGRLFRRSGRGVALTKRDELVLGYAVAMAQSLEEAARVVRDRSETGPARICIGAQPTTARLMLGSG
ncbi:LysR family transcriptional regulator [Robbsia andropogonis]|uniref:LysR family transcriptional regulator n=1 Tax=Robbsia andropogonis TaxID=28092 RepID=UPI000465A1DE|nr:LysR family transcriptional regulator [Robbsia andropogonis]MCP1118009.1 LysR family transcriptional regulator [Robbsia andropogonis]MCP1127710.1 LysR family transcriptional regulator [Robbsia andropogonis]